MKLRPLTWPILVLVAAAALRVLWLGSVPGGIDQHEAAVGYRAWALIHAGFNEGAPAWLRHAGDGGGADDLLYAVLSTPFIAMSGLSTWTIRLPAAIAGVLSLLMFWQLGRRAEPGMAGASLLVIVTSPWHLMASRWAHGEHVAPAMLLLGILLMDRARSSQAYAPLAVLAFIVPVCAREVTPVFAAAFLIWTLVIVYQTSPVPRLARGTALFASPLVLLPLTTLVQGRWQGSPSPLRGPGHGGVFAVHVPADVAHVLENATGVVTLFVGTLKDASPWSAAGFNPHLAVLLPFLVWGLVYALSHREALVDRLMLAWFVCAVGAAACFTATVDSMSLVWLPALWLSARGLWMLRDERGWSLAVRSVVGACGIAFGICYFANLGGRAYDGPWVGFGDALKRVSQRAPRDATVVVTSHTPMAYLPTLFFSRTPPSRLLSIMAPSAGLDAPVDLAAFDRFRFGITPDNVTRSQGRSYWVAHRTELAFFDRDDMAVETFAQHAVVTGRSAAEMGCLLPVEPRRLRGTQDVSKVTENGSVGAPGAGFTVAGAYFTRGFGVHGNSVWTLRRSVPIHEVSFGIGLSDAAKCSDGMRFSVLADDNLVFMSEPLRAGDLEYRRIPLHGETSITFATHAGGTNACDHGNWLRPNLLTCG